LRFLRSFAANHFAGFSAAGKSAAEAGAVQTLRVVLAIGVVGLYVTGGYVNLPVSNRHNSVRNLCKAASPRGVVSGLWPEIQDFKSEKSRHSLDATPTLHFCRDLRQG
jgi:hypothetical protein